jgi:tRNA (guanosine-2'-O-)-methyltransferase
LKAHVVLPEKGLDLHHHTAAGTTKWVQVEVHESVEKAASTLKARGFSVLAAHPAEGARDYREVDFTRPTALMMGAELDGLSEEGLAAADGLVVIPMAGMVRSLNVSVATALLLFEAFRQREAAGLYASSRIPPEEFTPLLFEWAYPELAAVYRKRGQPYPQLSPEGELLG